VKTPAILIVTMLSLTSLAASAGVTVRYYNQDSRKYELEATCSGSKYPASFDANATSNVTIQGSGPCVLHTERGDVTLRGDEKIEIKDGRFSIR
jgi:hypothetical protein